jgi:hypothetical protein
MEDIKDTEASELFGIFDFTFQTFHKQHTPI